MTQDDSQESGFNQRLWEKVQELDRNVNNLQFGEERFAIRDALDYLLKLHVTNRQMVITERTYARFMNLRFSLPNIWNLPTMSGGERLLEQTRWFDGAMRETTDPIGVFNEWLKTLKTEG